MRVEAFIQARMGSSRLPGKVLKQVMGRPLLDYLITRLKEASQIDDIVVLTTSLPEDDVIVSFCKERDISFYRGDSEDVLSRFYYCAKSRHVDAIVRITADCPLLDPEIVDSVVGEFRLLDGKCDYLSNTLERTYPRGLDVEVFTAKALQMAHEESKTGSEREHVTLYMYRNPALFRLKNMAHTPPLSRYRLTVDTEEDFCLIRLILTHLFPTYPHFRMKDIISLLAAHPHWERLNAHICQKPLDVKQKNLL